MQLILTEDDFQQSLGVSGTKKLVHQQKEAILGDNASGSTQAVLDALPRVLVHRLKNMIPSGYEVKQVQIKVQFSGQPFGVGVAGDATVTFGPSS